LALRPEYIVVGQFGRLRGLAGEIYINPLTDNPERFQGKEKFWIESEDGWKEIEIEIVSNFSGRPVARVAGIDTPEQARTLANRYLYIESSALGKLPDGRYYYFDLVGCRVTDEKGTDLGTVMEVETYPANDVLVIESSGGTRNYLPVVRVFVKEIEIEKKLIIISPPEGMFDSPDKN
jgi:16S rRNA processing protein RimM